MVNYELVAQQAAEIDRLKKELAIVTAQMNLEIALRDVRERDARQMTQSATEILDMVTTRLEDERRDRQIIAETAQTMLRALVVAGVQHFGPKRPTR